VREVILRLPYDGQRKFNETSDFGSTHGSTHDVHPVKIYVPLRETVSWFLANLRWDLVERIASLVAEKKDLRIGSRPILGQ
jgi:hypothetical protein